MMVSGVLLMILGALYVLGARRLRDSALRRLQRESYVTTVRGLGAFLMLAGAALLVAVAFQLI
jgi:hypothetical protein